ncbi:Citrate lyase subunit beta-like protein [compost metagenome]
MNEDMHLVRSALFVPGNRPERFAKALASGADAVIVDFEDAVAEADKPQARLHLAAFLEQHPQQRVLVRVNAAGHAEHEADLQLCGELAGVVAVLLPKAESSAQVESVAATGKPVWPISESARGVLALAQVAACSGVARLTFGALDLALDMGFNAQSVGAVGLFDQVRFGLLLHSRVNGLAAPLDSVYPAFMDDEGLAVAMRRGRDMGMGGALCIHPRQVAVVHEAMAPSAEERAWAQRVIDGAACGAAAFEVDGQMVDAPVLSRARRVLASG